MNFNPRPREGNDNASGRIGLPRGISTHVPARGTTSQFFKSVEDFTISTHVPARGTTVEAAPIPQVEGISTHVPARGTTVFRKTP